MPVYVNDWLASGSITVMSPLAELAYFRLLLFQWKAPDCLLPDDTDEKLAAWSRANGSWPEIKDSVLAHFMFEKKTKKLFNKKLRSYWLKAVENNKAKRRGGINSGKTRRKAVNSLPVLFEQNANTPPNSTRTKSNISSSSSSSISEEFKNLTPLTPLRGAHAPGKAKMYPRKGDCTAEEIQVARGIFQIMNQRAGMNFQASHPNGEATENVKFVAALLRKGHSADELRRVALHQFTFWSARPDGAAFLRDYYRPETLFNLTKYAGYVAKLPPKPAAGETTGPLDDREVLP